MAKFITGTDLEEAVYSIIWDASQTLMIVSPFVKLDGYFKKLFEKHIDDPKLHLLLVFGKNEGNESKSLGKNDFDFFKNFKNVSIIYEATLHAKYYGNESKGVITSINLHDYSFKNNIEFGVYSELSLLNSFTNQADKQAWEKCLEIAENGEAIFIKRPVYKKKFLNTLTGNKEFVKSEILHDSTDLIYSFNIKNRSDRKRLNDFPDHIDSENKNDAMPTREQIENGKSETYTPVQAETQSR